MFSLGSLALLGYLIEQNWFYFGLGISYKSDYVALVLFSLTLPVFSFFITPISNHFSRKHEFQADAFAARHTDSNDLISSLIKLYRENSSTLCPDKYYSLFHDSHPNAALRIAELKWQLQTLLSDINTKTKNGTSRKYTLSVLQDQTELQKIQKILTYTQPKR